MTGATSDGLADFTFPAGETYIVLSYRGEVIAKQMFVNFGFTILDDAAVESIALSGRHRWELFHDWSQALTDMTSCLLHINRVGQPRFNNFIGERFKHNMTQLINEFIEDDTVGFTAADVSRLLTILGELNHNGHCGLPTRATQTKIAQVVRSLVKNYVEKLSRFRFQRNVESSGIRFRERNRRQTSLYSARCRRWLELNVAGPEIRAKCGTPCDVEWDLCAPVSMGGLNASGIPTCVDFDAAFSSARDKIVDVNFYDSCDTSPVSLFAPICNTCMEKDPSASINDLRVVLNLISPLEVKQCDASVTWFAIESAMVLGGSIGEIMVLGEKAAEVLASHVTMFIEKVVLGSSIGVGCSPGEHCPRLHFDSDELEYYSHWICKLPSHACEGVGLETGRFAANLLDCGLYTYDLLSEAVMTRVVNPATGLALTLNISIDFFVAGINFEIQSRLICLQASAMTGKWVTSGVPVVSPVSGGVMAKCTYRTGANEIFAVARDKLTSTAPRAPSTVATGYVEPSTSSVVQTPTRVIGTRTKRPATTPEVTFRKPPITVPSPELHSSVEDETSEDDRIESFWVIVPVIGAVVIVALGAIMVRTSTSSTGATLSYFSVAATQTTGSDHILYQSIGLNKNMSLSLLRKMLAERFSEVEAEFNFVTLAGKDVSTDLEASLNISDLFENRISVRLWAAPENTDAEEAAHSEGGTPSLELPAVRAGGDGTNV